MDPRFNPNLAAAQAGNLMQDVHPSAAPAQPQGSPAAYAAPTPAGPPEVPISIQPAPEVPQMPPVAAPHEAVDSIPVRQQGQPYSSPAPPASAPVMQMPGYEGAPRQQEEDDLDRILQAVNNRVKAPGSTAAPKRGGGIFKGLAGKAGNLKNLLKIPKPFGPVLAALAVAVALSITAVLAYRQGGTTSLSNQPGKVGTNSAAASSIQQAGGLLVRPNDLDDFSQELQTKLNSLNDSQDFSASPLSDQMLGL
ncbi:MAG: hypothetical protein JWO96_444 [Candidatus Saccharibacteria bacterium]|nr:hypothetical protein [Candidatus Saccharibacteria bacterium]